MTTFLPQDELAPKPLAGRLARPASRLAAWALIAVIAGWLLWPAIDPVHVEGFSASMVALGLHVAHGTVADFMPYAALDTDYFGLTKLGAVLGVAALSFLFGGDGAMRVIMLASLVVLLAASADLIRRWTAARWPVIAIVLILVPGVAENAFFFNDNLPAAALLVLALAMLDRARSWPLALVAGLLVGGAVAVRTDVVLVAVVATPLVALKRQGLRAAVLSTVVAGLAALAVLFAAFASVHASPLDSIRVGSLVVKLWDRPVQPVQSVLQFLYFTGCAGLILMLVGVFDLRARKSWRELALLAAPPLVYIAVFCQSLWESRQFLTLTPFLCGLAALGAERAIAGWPAGRRALPAALGVIVLVQFLGPAQGVLVSDGPRVLIGRLHGLGLWEAWQAGNRQDLATAERLVAGLPAGRPAAVLTDGWDDDRYLHLALVERGFHRTALPPACGLIGEGMQRGDRRMVQLTLHQSFVPYWPVLEPQRLEQGALPCLAAIKPAEVLLVGRKARIDALLHPAGQGRALGSDLHATSTSRIVAVSLDAKSLAALDQAYRREAAAIGQKHDLADAQATLVSRTGFSRPAPAAGS